jgi:hypothetical protein
MSDQPLQRRFLRRASVLVVLVVLVVAVPLAVDYYWRAFYYYREGVTDGCAEQFEFDKADLAGYHWGWWPLPGWVCEFERNGQRWERRLR